MLKIAGPNPVHYCWPWRLRFLETNAEDPAIYGTYGASCCYCDREVAAPKWASGRTVACIYCGLDNGAIPAEDRPFALER